MNGCTSRRQTSIRVHHRMSTCQTSIAICNASSVSVPAHSQLLVQGPTMIVEKLAYMSAAGILARPLQPQCMHQLNPQLM
jgi:hypothetical protein